VAASADRMVLVAELLRAAVEMAVMMPCP